jgi:hypothetical protein
MKMGQRQKGPNYVLQKMTKVPLSIKYQSATIIGGAHVQYIYKLSTKFESPGLKTVRGVDYTK